MMHHRGWCIIGTIYWRAQPTGLGHCHFPRGVLIPVSLVHRSHTLRGSSWGAGALWPPHVYPLLSPAVYFAANSLMNLSLTAKGLVRGPGHGWWCQKADVPSCQICITAQAIAFSFFFFFFIGVGTWHTFLLYPRRALSGSV